MHRAPAVSYSVHRSRWQGRLIILLSLLAATAVGGFANEQSGLDARFLVMAGGILVVGTLALRCWQNSPQGGLRWDGQHWFWTGFAAPHTCNLALVLDFQSVVLVSVAVEARTPIWLWLEGSRVDPAWKALRRAIVASPATSRTHGESTESRCREDVL